MRIAEILSDLTSLRVCDQSAALALVSARPTTSSTTTINISPAQSNQEASASIQQQQHPSTSSSITPDSVAGDDDVDLTRARNLLELHATVKVANANGLDRGLSRARQDVENVLRYV